MSRNSELLVLYATHIVKQSDVSKVNPNAPVYEELELTPNDSDIDRFMWSNIWACARNFYSYDSFRG